MKYKILRKLRNSKFGILLDYRIVLIFILLSGFLIRYHIAGTVSIWNDEAITANAALSLLDGGVPDFPSGYEYWRAFPYTVLVAISSALLGVSDVALRAPSLIFSLLSMLATYEVGKDLFDRDIGMIAVTVMAFSGIQVFWSAQVRMYIMLQFLYLISVFGIYRMVESGSFKKGIISIPLIILSIFIHITAQILPFIAILYIIYRKKVLDSNFTFKAVITLIISVFVLHFVPDISFTYIFNRLGFSPENIRFYYLRVFKYSLPLFALGLFGSVISLKDSRKEGVITGLAVFPAFYLYLIHVSGVSARYLLFSIPFFAIWTGVSVKYISKYIKDYLSCSRNLNLPLRNIIIALTILVVLLNSFGTGAEDYRPIIDERAAYNFIENNSNGEDVLITQWTSSASYYYKAPDYSLYADNQSRSYFNTTFYRQEYSYNNVDMYSGAEFIDNKEELKEIIQNNEKGWIVLRDISYDRKNDEVKEVISRLYKMKEPDRLKIWKWNGSVNLGD